MSELSRGRKKSEFALLDLAIMKTRGIREDLHKLREELQWNLAIMKVKSPSGRCTQVYGRIEKYENRSEAIFARAQVRAN